MSGIFSSGAFALIKSLFSTAGGAAMIGTANGVTVEARLAGMLSSADLGGGSVQMFSVGVPSPGVVSRFMVTKQITAHANYGYLDDSTISYGGVAFQAHASFNDNAKNNSAQDSDHDHSYQSYRHYGGSGALGRFSSFWSQLDHTGSGTISEASLFKANNPLGVGPIATLYGLFVDGLTRGAKNWGIYIKGVVPSFFGGALLLGQEANPARIEYNLQTGHLEIQARAGYETRYVARMHRFGLVESEACFIDQNADGNSYMTPRAGYKFRFTTESIEIAQPGKGIVLSNLAGTIKKTVTLSADGLSLVLV